MVYLSIDYDYKLTSMIRYTIRNYQNLTRKTTACFSTRVAGDFEFH